MDLEDKTRPSPTPTFSQRDTLLHLSVTREERATEGHPSCAVKDTPLSEEVLIQATTYTGPESEESAPRRQTLSASGDSKPALSPIPDVLVRDSPIRRASCAPPWGGNSLCADRQWGVSQITAFTPTAEIRYLSSWCAPAANLRGSVDRERGRDAYDKQPRSPTTISRLVSTSLKDLEASGDILRSGIKEDSFSPTEWEFVQNNMHLLGLSREENSGYIYPNSFKSKRKALRVLMGDLRGADVAAPTPRGSIRGNHAYLWRYVDPTIDTLIEASFPKFAGWRLSRTTRHHLDNDNLG